MLKLGRAMISWWVVLGCLGATRACEPDLVRRENAIEIGSQRELFVDDHLVERLQGASLRLQRPHDEGIAASRPFHWSLHRIRRLRAASSIAYYVSLEILRDRLSQPGFLATVAVTLGFRIGKRPLSEESIQ